MPDKPGEDLKHPACGDCVHYHVTWDRAAPHGYSSFGFKTSRQPSHVVYENSGTVCELFASRKGVRQTGRT